MKPLLSLLLLLASTASWAKKEALPLHTANSCARFATLADREKYIWDNPPENNHLWAVLVLEWMSMDYDHFWKASEKRGYVPPVTLLDNLDNSPCLRAEQVHALTQSVFKKAIVNLDSKGAPHHVLQTVQIFASQLRQWEESEKKTLIEDTTRALRNNFILTHTDHFPSRIFYFIEARLNQVVDNTAKVIQTDASAIRLTKESVPYVARVYIYANEAPNVTVYPYYRSRPEVVTHNYQDYFQITQISLMTFEKETLEWEVGQNQKDKRREYRIEVLAKKLGDGILRTAEGPRLNEIWRDKHLTGLLMLSKNLKTDTNEVFNEYKEYYEGEGFTFTEKSSIPSKEFIHKKLASGEVDYLFKEAHSLGDDRNLVELSEESTLLTGTKALPEGREEVFYILKPETSTSAFVANAEFGRWIQERAKIPNAGEIIYLNMSCSSDSKACREFTAAKSPLFTVIYSVSSTNWFLNNPNWPPYVLIDGIRRGKSYAQIRAGVAESVTAARGRGIKPADNRYVYPFQPEYKNQLGGILIDLQTEVSRKVGPDKWEVLPTFLNDAP